MNARPCGEHLSTMLRARLALLQDIALNSCISRIAHFPFLIPVSCFYDIYFKKMLQRCLCIIAYIFFLDLPTMPDNLYLSWICDRIFAFLMCNDHCLLLFSPAI